jgi:hypothetical protein
MSPGLKPASQAAADGRRRRVRRGARSPRSVERSQGSPHDSRSALPDRSASVLRSRHKHRLCRAAREVLSALGSGWIRLTIREGRWRALATLDGARASRPTAQTSLRSHATQRRTLRHTVLGYVAPARSRGPLLPPRARTRHNAAPCATRSRVTSHPTPPRALARDTTPDPATHGPGLRRTPPRRARPHATQRRTLRHTVLGYVAPARSRGPLLPPRAPARDTTPDPAPHGPGLRRPGALARPAPSAADRR